MNFIVDTFVPGDTITIVIAVQKTTFAPLNPTEISSVTMTLTDPNGLIVLSNVTMSTTMANGDPLPPQQFQYVWTSLTSSTQSTTVPWTATFTAIGELGKVITFPIPLFWLSALGPVQ